MEKKKEVQRWKAVVSADFSCYLLQKKKKILPHFLYCAIISEKAGEKAREEKCQRPVSQLQ
jgi:hypothetical protein